MGVEEFHRDVWNAAVWGFVLLQGKFQIEAGVNLGLGTKDQVPPISRMKILQEIVLSLAEGRHLKDLAS
jgi:hypothetical protein